MGSAKNPLLSSRCPALCMTTSKSRRRRCIWHCCLRPYESKKIFNIHIYIHILQCPHSNEEVVSRVIPSWAYTDSHQASIGCMDAWWESMHHTSPNSGCNGCLVGINASYCPRVVITLDAWWESRRHTVSEQSLHWMHLWQIT